MIEYRIVGKQGHFGESSYSRYNDAEDDRFYARQKFPDDDFIIESRTISDWSRYVEKDERPHSRACGMKNHDHGVDCSSNCPTCGGK